MTVNLAQDDREKLSQEATRLALLMEYARDEAIVRGAEIAWQLKGDAYHFSYKDDSEKWINLDSDDIFRSRKFSPPMQATSLKIDQNLVGDDTPVLFSPSGLNHAFELQLALKAARATLTRDVLGRVKTNTMAGPAK